MSYTSLQKWACNKYTLHTWQQSWKAAFGQFALTTPTSLNNLWYLLVQLYPTPREEQRSRTVTTMKILKTVIPIFPSVQNKCHCCKRVLGHCWATLIILMQFLSQIPSFYNQRSSQFLFYLSATWQMPFVCQIHCIQVHLTVIKSVL